MKYIRCGSSNKNKMAYFDMEADVDFEEENITIRIGICAMNKKVNSY